MALDPILGDVRDDQEEKEVKYNRGTWRSDTVKYGADLEWMLGRAAWHYVQTSKLGFAERASQWDHSVEFWLGRSLLLHSGIEFGS